MPMGLVAISVLVALFSVLFVSEATMGLYLVGWAALLGIYGRVAQAGEQHTEILGKLKKQAESEE